LTPKEYEAELKDLEIKLERLRSLYDQYFRGLEKLPPLVLKKEVENKIRVLSKIHMKNTALRFKLQVQIQKYTTFLAYWQRLIREMEEGKVMRWKTGEERKPQSDDEETGKFLEKGLTAGRVESEGDDDLAIDIDVVSNIGQDRGNER